MSNDSNEQQTQREWFDGLDLMSERTATSLLSSGKTITCMRGTDFDEISRSKALALIAEGARLAPSGQEPIYLLHQIVVIDIDGKPIQLRSKN